MKKVNEEKAPTKVGFFKNWLMAYKARRLLKWSKELGLSLVKIVRRGDAHYIQTKDGQLFRIGRGPK